MLPRLHLVTNDAVVAAATFPAQAEAILQELGAQVALHLRARSASGHLLHDLACRLIRLPQAIVLLNERVDVAMATGASGVQLPARSLPVQAVRSLLGPDRWIGCSVHHLAEALLADAEGADFLVAGTIYASATHPTAPARGPGFLQELAAQVRLPIIAIGGVDLERVPECTRLGAYGIAVIRAVWAAPHPIHAARALLAQMSEVTGGE
ncbi:MAG: thiamine phosphate synthase [Longimicrobiales bacterium]